MVKRKQSHLSPPKLFIPADLLLVQDLNEFRINVQKDLDEGTEVAAENAGLAYQRVMASLFPEEYRTLSSDWSRLNLDVSEENWQRFSSTIDRISHRSSRNTNF